MKRKIKLKLVLYIILAALVLNGENFNEFIGKNVESDYHSECEVMPDASGSDWHSQITLPVGDIPTSVFIGDANNDGYNDLVTSNVAAPHTISILLWNNTIWDWNPQITRDVDWGLPSIFIGDVNNDGYNDIATVCRYSERVAILLWNSTSGDWNPPIFRTVYYDSQCIFIGDANNDGYNDIVTASFDSNGISILLWNSTSGDWNPQIIRNVGGWGLNVFIGDANNDGYNDITTTSSGSDTIFILVWNSALQDWNIPISKSVGDAPSSVFIGDADNDGYNDLVTANYVSDTVSILLWNSTSGDLDPQITHAVEDTPFSVFIGDADNDRYNDIAIANQGSDTVSILLWNNTLGDWNSQITRAVGDAPSSVFIGDADNDGYNDIATANTLSDTISLLLWNSPPLIIINYPVENDIFGKIAPRFHIQVRDIDLDTIWYTLDEGLTNFTLIDNTPISQELWDTFEDGFVNITFYANDTIGNLGFTTLRIIKDLKVPIINIIKPEMNQEFDESGLGFNISVEELHPFDMWYTIDGGLTNISFTEFIGVVDQNLWFAAPNGPLILRFYAKDVANNTSYEDVVVIKNSTLVSPINILTPYNITYSQPMSGYYPATFGFENDVVGDFPYDWVEDGYGSYQGRVYVVDSKEGHKNVMYLNDPGGGIHLYPGQTFDEEVISGTIELWIYYTSHTYNTHIFIMNSLDQYLVDIFSNNNYWKYMNGTSEISTGLYSINQWFRISIDFSGDGSYKDLPANTFKFRMFKADGSLYFESSIALFSNTGMPYEFEIYTGNTQAIQIWVDAVGYSWKSNYEMGDNSEEGLLLSFEQYISLEWIGYSLDGMSNRTILGNISIPFPADDSHSIQVFCNDSFGNNYHSNPVYFTIDTILPKIEIYTPCQYQMFDITPPKYNISIIETNLASSWYTLDNGMTNYSFTNLNDFIELEVWTQISNGLITITFYAEDLGGNIGFVNVTVIKFAQDYISIEIEDQLFSLNDFNITFYIFNASGYGIDSATIQLWWDGTDVSSAVQNLGNGYYLVSLEPLTVAPGEDPIFLNMTISASGYKDKYFETYIAVDPTSLLKGEGEPTEEFPLILIIIISAVSAGVIIGLVSIYWLRKRKREPQ